jgi:putative Mg2+ transporter-C (MgtC) family protein
VLLELAWTDIAIRLGLSFVAGSAIGLERGAQGRSAGLRTTLLVSLAASIAMILANLLLIEARRTPSGITSFDPLRLPLGVLSGMGFIGAGAILRRDDMILGVTTAATLWFVTMAGLCFGGGQLALGVAAAVLGLLILHGLEWAEDLIPRERKGTLVLSVTADGPADATIQSRLAATGFRATPRSLAYDGPSQNRTLSYEVSWRARRTETRVPPLLADFAADPGVASLNWTETPVT